MDRLYLGGGIILLSTRFRSKCYKSVEVFALN